MGNFFSDIWGGITDVVSAITPWNDDTTFGKIADFGIGAGLGYGALDAAGALGGAADAVTGVASGDAALGADLVSSAGAVPAAVDAVTGVASGDAALGAAATEGLGWSDLVSSAGAVPAAVDAVSAGSYFPSALDLSSISSLGMDLSPLTAGLTGGWQDATYSMQEIGTETIPGVYDVPPIDSGPPTSSWTNMLPDASFKNIATLAGLGLTGYKALSTQQLPEASKQLQETSTAINQQAAGVIAGGGTAAPQWTSQKSGIDSYIDQLSSQQTAALKQAQANKGEQGMVTTQQLNSLQQQMEYQRQQLYAQAQAANVSQAVQELTNTNTALSSVAQMQLDQSKAAQQSAQQTAQLTLMLQGLAPNKTTTTAATGGLI